MNRTARRISIAILALLAAGAAGECVLRVLLFAPIAMRWGIARELRDPGRFARWRDEDAFWVLQYLWSRAEDGEHWNADLYRHDDRVGWLTSSIEPGTYEHASETEIGARRPILLFGDSFSACTTPQGTCFEALIDESSLGRTHAMLNYGVHGFGLDQSYLLAREAVTHLEDSDPIVVIGVFVDDDLDRCILGFRGGPKPRLRAQEGRLQLPQQRVPTLGPYLEDDPALPDSYLLAWIRSGIRRVGLLGSPDSDSEKRELTRRILEAIVDELRERDLEFFFLLFNGPVATVDPSVLGWRQLLVREELSRHGAPWIEVRDGMLQIAEQGGGPVDGFFKAGDIHLNEAGNRAAFQSILRGLEGLGVEVPEPLWPLPPLWSLQADADEAGGGFCRYERAKNVFLGEPTVGSRLLLRGASRPARASFALEERCSRFGANAWVFAPRGRTDRHQLSLIVDGVERWTAALEASQPAVAVDVDLEGGQLLEIVVSTEPGARGGSCVVLSDPVLE